MGPPETDLGFPSVRVVLSITFIPKQRIIVDCRRWFRKCDPYLTGKGINTTTYWNSPANFRNSENCLYTEIILFFSCAIQSYANIQIVTNSTFWTYIFNTFWTKLCSSIKFSLFEYFLNCILFFLYFISIVYKQTQTKYVFMNCTEKCVL